MTDAPQPPLPDIDWTAAIEAASQAISEALEVNEGSYHAAEIAEQTAADVVRAVWPILHAAAQPVDLCAPLPRRAEQGGQP